MGEPSFFERLAEADRERVLQIGVRRRFRKGDYIFHAGDSGDRLYLIIAGRVAVQLVNREGNTTILALLGPGDCFGELALLGAGLRTASVMALEPLEAVTLSRADLHELRDDGRVVQGFLIEVLTTQVLRLTRRVIDAELGTAGDRVIARLADVTRVYDDGVVPVVVPMTQSTLAGLAGTTRPTVNKVLAGLAAAGFIRIRHGGLDVLDPAGLRRRADARITG
ncbi:MAG: Crp/Fnr family transcriptional regulator [Actinomycetota bacterium]|nr:Crp/Fnr family transcriptional regulator [Actinomycetota bacterium]